MLCEADAHTVRSRKETFSNNEGNEAMIWPLSTPNYFFVYGQKHKVLVLAFLVKTSRTC